MTGHWLMLIQLLLACVFIFGAVRKVAGTPPAFFALTWFLHSRHIVQRITCGLPRGWGAVILAAYLFVLLKGSERGVLLVLFLGCLLHPPSTILAAGAYALFLVLKVINKDTRADYVKPLVRFVCLAPLYAGLAFWVVDRPAEIGQMASYEVAKQLPEFQAPNGRFPFVPFLPALDEMRIFAFQAFLYRLYNPARWIKVFVPLAVGLLMLVLFLVGFRRRRPVCGTEILSYAGAIFITYFLSREFAFKLYVPDRHLQIPLALFFIVFFSSAVWIVLQRRISGAQSAIARAWPSALGLCVLGGLICLGSGSALGGTANFNYPVWLRGGVFEWIKHNLPDRALIAGDPTFLDPLMLVGRRRGYITSETAHPFYDRYLVQVRHRLDVSLRAHYAPDLREFVRILEPEGIDYFVFDRRKFYPDRLRNATYYAPFDGLMRELTQRPLEQYAYKQLPAQADLEKYPFMSFKDDYAVLVDVGKLRTFLEANPALNSLRQ
jgi:hypothetical protein